MQTTPELLRTIADLIESHGWDFWRQMEVYNGSWDLPVCEEAVWNRVFEFRPDQVRVKQ